MEKIAIYPGTFDPVTHGHADIVVRAAKLFDKVFFAIVDSTENTLFTTQERMTLAESVFSSLENVEICSFKQLVTDTARDLKAQVIVRGIRAAADFDYEFQMAGMNRNLYADAETIFLRPAENLSCISSTLVKEIVALGGDARHFVASNVLQALHKKFAR